MNTTRNWILLTLFTLLSFFTVRWLANYQEKKNTITEPTVDVDIDAIKERGTLRVIMEYNSISYFIYKGQRLGFEFELMQHFAKAIGVKLEVIIAKTTDEQFNLLNEGKGDIIANGIIQNSKIKQQVALTQAYRDVEQVLVQRRSGISVNPIDSIQKNDTLLQNVNELSNKIVYVADNSSYYTSLKELSDSSGINMDVRILPDERGVDDIIEAIANGEIDYTIANKDIALLNKSYFENLNVDVAVGKKQALHWAVRKNAPDLLSSINYWLTKFEKGKTFSALYYKYFNEEKNVAYGYNENAELQLSSNFTGTKIAHHGIEVRAGDFFAVTDSANQSNGFTHYFNDENDYFEQVTFQKVTAENIVKFIYDNKSSAIEVKLIGKKTYKYNLNPTDIKAIAESYQLWVVRKDILKLEKEIQKASLIINRINFRKINNI